MTSISTSPRTVEEIFRDYTGRRSALLRALTLDVDDFYSQCNPEKENLCLYGHANESWEVTLPAEEVPPELPEPALGINFARDGMQRKDWLSLVAVHSDCWLLSVAFYFGARLNCNERDHKRDMRKLTRSYSRRVMGMMKMSMGRPSVAAVEELTARTSFGLGAISANDGTMENA
ncbi:PHD finger protein ALFIN-LIKE 1 [Linum grandiflorum]